MKKYFVILFTFFTLSLSLLFPQEWIAPNLNHALSFGHDFLGRSVMVVTWKAAFTGLITSTILYGLILLLGILISIIIHTLPQSLQSILDSAIDQILSIPSIILGMLLAGVLGSGLTAYIITMLFAVLPSLIRKLIESIKTTTNTQYYLSSISMGGLKFKSIYTHALPDFISLIIALTPMMMTRIILLDASLTFLGIVPLGSNESLGQIIWQGKDYLLEAPWISLTSCFFLFLILYSIQSPIRIKE